MSHELNDKTKIPLGWAITILMSISGVIGSAAVAHYRLARLEADWALYQKGMEAKTEIDRAQELKIQRLEITLQSIEVFLSRIDAKLERMEIRNGR